MPTYDYRCKECGTTVSAIRGMNEKPDTVCPGCGGVLSRVYTAFQVSVKRFTPKPGAVDQIKKQMDMRDELREDHMVHGVTPLQGQSLDSVYKDIVSSGSKVREQMEKTREENLAKDEAASRQHAKDLQAKLPKLNESAKRDAEKRKQHQAKEKVK